MDLAGIGAIMSGAGAIGGLFGDDGGMTPRQAADSQMRGTVAGAMKAGKKHGIHPLYLLGTHAAGGIVGQSNTGSQVSDALAAAGGAVSSYAERQQLKAQVDLENKLRIAETSASVQESEARARLLEAQRLDIATGGTFRAGAASEVARAAQGFQSQKDKTIRSPVPGMDHTPNALYTDQQVVEDKYGGVVGELYGLGRYLGEQGEALGKWLYHRQRQNRDANRGARSYPYTGGNF